MLEESNFERVGIVDPNSLKESGPVEDTTVYVNVGFEKWAPRSAARVYYQTGMVGLDYVNDGGYEVRRRGEVRWDHPNGARESREQVRVEPRPQKQSEPVSKPPAQKGDLGDSVVEFLDSNPASGAGDIKKALGISQGKWTRLSRELLDEGRIYKEGKKRGTKYFCS